MERNKAAEEIARVASARPAYQRKGKTWWQITRPGPMPGPEGKNRSTLRSYIKQAEKALHSMTYHHGPLRERREFWTSRLRELLAYEATLPPEKIRLTNPDPPIKKAKVSRLPGQGIGGVIKVPFEQVQACRKLHEEQKLSFAEIAERTGHNYTNVRSWCSYQTRNNK